MKTLPLIFFGSSNFSLYVLKEFLKKYKPVLVLTLKAKPAGRKLKLQLNPVFSLCLKEKLNVIEFEDWKKLKRDLSLIKPLVGVIAGFAKISPKEIIDIFPKGILNVHPSLLPKYRGPNPIREVILNNEKETGVTIFLIDELIDQGPILTQEIFPLSGKETYKELEEKLGGLGGKKLAEIIEDYLESNIKAFPQDGSLATYTKKIEKEDGLLKIDEDIGVWQRKVRALNPWPGTFIYLIFKNNKVKLLKIFSLEKIEEKNLPREIKKLKMGEFFQFKNELGLRIKGSFILIKELQLQDRKKMSSKEFLNGYKIGSFRYYFKDNSS